MREIRKQTHWTCKDQSLILSLRLKNKVINIIYPKAFLSNRRRSVMKWLESQLKIIGLFITTDIYTDFYSYLAHRKSSVHKNLIVAAVNISLLLLKKRDRFKRCIRDLFKTIQHKQLILEQGLETRSSAWLQTWSYFHQTSFFWYVKRYLSKSNM